MSGCCISSCEPIYHMAVQDGVSFNVDNVKGASFSIDNKDGANFNIDNGNDANFNIDNGNDASFKIGGKLEDRELLAKYQGMVNKLDMLKDEIDDLDALWRDIIAGAGLTAIDAEEVERLF